MANNNINRSLTGIDPLAYMGINASGSLSAPQMVTQNRAPTINDSKNFIIGCLWLKPDVLSPAADAEIWMLTSLIGNEATWTPLATTSAGSLSTLTGDSGGAVPGTAGNINILSAAGSGLTVVGTPGTSTLTISGTGGGSVVNTLTGNSGGPVPALAGNINVVGSGDVVVTGNAGTNTLTITTSGAVANSFPTNAGTATPAAGVLNILGSGSISTSGAGNTVTISSSALSSISITGDSGGALVGSAFTFTGGTTGLTFSGAGTTETLTGTLVVANGGTGRSSHTAYAVICGGTTSTNPQQSIASVGTAGQVLTSNGAGALPTFQAVGGGAGILSASLNLTAVQIKALDTVPQTVVAAQGAGTFIDLIEWVIKFNYGGTSAFTNASAANNGIGLYVNDKVAQCMGQNAIKATATLYHKGPLLDNTTNGVSIGVAAENSPLLIFCTDAIGGNAEDNNTLTVDVLYRVLTL